jgi:hypothetical protein
MSGLKSRRRIVGGALKTRDEPLDCFNEVRIGRQVNMFWMSADEDEQGGVVTGNG